MHFRKIKYENLNARQQENYNFQKIAAVLAEYGYSCMWLNDDWQGADFIANHIDGVEFLKVQLKGRLTINKKYIGKNIYIVFRHLENTYLYPHDELVNSITKKLPKAVQSKSWERGGYAWPNPPKQLKEVLNQYKL